MSREIVARWLADQDAMAWIEMSPRHQGDYLRLADELLALLPGDADRELGANVRKLVESEGLLCVHKDDRFGRIVVRVGRLDRPTIEASHDALDAAVSQALAGKGEGA